MPGALSGAPAGWLDPGFGRNGIVRPTFVGNDQPAGVAVQGDGKIVVAATAFRSSSQWSFAIARYRVDGRLDTSFGSAGKVLVDHGSATNGSATAIAVQPEARSLSSAGLASRSPRSRAILRSSG